MKLIIKRYLDKCYKLTTKGYVSFTVYDNSSKLEVSPKTLFRETARAFSITEETLRPIYEEWVDVQIITLENKLVDLQEKIYLQTGQVITSPSISPQIDSEAINHLPLEGLDSVLDLRGRLGL